MLASLYLEYLMSFYCEKNAKISCLGSDYSYVLKNTHIENLVLKWVEKYSNEREFYLKYTQIGHLRLATLQLASVGQHNCSEMPFR